MAKLEKQKTEIDSKLAQPEVYNTENKPQLTEMLKQQSLIQTELSEAEELWLAAMEELEQAED